MSDYTLEEVIDFINSEINDAYTEASKEEADKIAERGRRNREIYKEINDKGKLIDPKFAEPKGDEATRRKKDIRKNYTRDVYISQKKKKPGKRYYDHPGVFFTHGYSPYQKKYDEIEQREEELQDKLREKAHDFKSKKGKEYEVYNSGKSTKATKEFIKKTRSEGKHPITFDEYKRYAYAKNNPEYKKSKKRVDDAFRKLDVSNRLAEKAEKGFKNKDVEAKWKKFVDKYEETVYDILEAYEYDIISYEAANDYLDMLALFED